ncbi:hypothetical protein AMS68_004601 [Peltaster fructicola]|uniref:Calcium channel YVC1-like C-terminal transmembrane domain-containing protein n=1 Tax=Peltaster fructicola TaxID=286661 RepID=A0A6H0XWI0_9PEZI|nr:hypothetical protein AMS68_004601 [Peltaster fructicola]
MRSHEQIPLPDITGSESYDAIAAKLSLCVSICVQTDVNQAYHEHSYLASAIETPSTFTELRTTKYGATLRPLVRYLADNVQHRLTVAALLALKGHYDAAEDVDDRGINATRSRACEIVAWRFVVRLSDRDAVDHLCTNLPVIARKPQPNTQTSGVMNDESAPLLGQQRNHDSITQELLLEDSKYFATTYANHNALEIAVVTGSKAFLSQKAVQRIIDGLWKGDIVFWTSLNGRSVKEAKFYNPRHSDPFCRLRVPMYLKTFEVLFFVAFLIFYYDLLVTKPVFSVSAAEIALYIWLAAFTYNEIGEFWDAGLTLYAADFWALWDILIIADGIAFFVTRMVGLTHADHATIDIAFDILSVEALFLVPRLCSVLSLHPYFGTLLPCLKEMTKDFLKFLGLIAIVYLGFNTCFAFLARGTYTFSEMSYILVKVFFGSSYLGFDVAERISPLLGPPLMIIFVCMTNILLITSLISLLSNSLSRVIQHSREEYLFVYAVYVLEASTSNRLTYYIPPLNLVPLLLRPLRLILPAEQLREIRIWLLKASHWPLVASIIIYEKGRKLFKNRKSANIAYVASDSDRPHLPAILRRPLSVRTTTNPSAISYPVDHLRQVPEASHGLPRSETIAALEQLAVEIERQSHTIQTLLDRERSRAQYAAATT